MSERLRADRRTLLGRLVRGAALAGAAVAGLPLLNACAPAPAAPTAAPAKPSEAPKPGEAAKPAAPTAPPSAEIVLKFAFGQTIDHPMGVGAQKFASVVSQKTGGKLGVQLFPIGTLGSERENAESIQLGALQGGLISAGFSPTFVPESALILLPYLFKDIDTAYRALDGAPGQMVLELFPPKGFHPLGFFDNARLRHITNKARPITQPDDLKGLKIRVMDNPIQIATYRRLGAAPTAMSIAEVYTALQQGVVDGQENPLANIYTTRFYEVQKYVSLTGMQYDPMFVVMNPKFFQGLSKEHQDAIAEAAAEGRKASRDNAGEREAEFEKLLKEKGMEFNEVDKAALTTATRPVWDEFTTEPKARAIADAFLNFS
jgi:tripartite ATP-independent transporter DctP family solute receptor